MENLDQMASDLKEGNDEVLGDLFSLYRERLWRMLHLRMDRRLYGRVDADDVLQEVYIAASKRLDHWRKEPEMSFFVWLRMIATQTLIDVHRRHLGAKMRDANLEVSIGGSPRASSVSLAGFILGKMTSPSQVAMRSEMTAHVENALEGMEAIDREILALRHFEELTNNEVAETLGLQKSATSNRYVRALGRLRKVLSEIPGFFDDEEGTDDRDPGRA